MVSEKKHAELQKKHAKLINERNSKLGQIRNMRLRLLKIRAQIDHMLKHPYAISNNSPYLDERQKKMEVGNEHKQNHTQNR